MSTLGVVTMATRPLAVTEGSLSSPATVMGTQSSMTSQDELYRGELSEMKKNPLYEIIDSRITHHIRICERQIEKYSRWSLRTRWSLPLLTAISTFIASGLAGLNVHGNAEVWIPLTLAAVSFSATVISALNAAIRPAIQYGHYVRYINRFWKQRVLLEFDVEQVLICTKERHEREKELIDTLRERNVEVERTIAGFSEESANNIGLPIAKGMHMSTERA